MDRVLFRDLNTNEVQLLFDMATLKEPFTLNEAFAAFNHGKLCKLDFYVLFFGLQTLGLVKVVYIPVECVIGNTNITYQVSTGGIEVVTLYKKLFM